MLAEYYAQCEPAGVRDLFRTKGYAAVDTIKSANQGDLVLSSIPPYLRTLLVTDGTVTKSLEAYYWEPVVVDVLMQERQPAEADIQWMDAKAGEDLLLREVRLRGSISDRIYAFAFSIIRLGTIPEELREGLLSQCIGIGELIRDCGLESYREILDIGMKREPGYSRLPRAAEPAMTDFVYRTYRIIVNHNPMILITESFPTEIFATPLS